MKNYLFLFLLPAPFWAAAAIRAVPMAEAIPVHLKPDASAVHNGSYQQSPRAVGCFLASA